MKQAGPWLSSPPSPAGGGGGPLCPVAHVACADLSIRGRRLDLPPGPQSADLHQLERPPASQGGSVPPSMRPREQEEPPPWPKAPGATTSPPAPPPRPLNQG